MKTLTLLLISCAALAADEPAKTEKPKPITEFPEEATDGEVPGWGQRRNPTRAGKFEVDGTALRITSASGTDMMADSGTSAPSVLTEIEGDFTAEVTLDPLPTDHSGWVGGGIVALVNDAERVVRLGHAHHKPKPDEPYNEKLDWVRSNRGGETRFINLSAIQFDPAKPRIFRLERKGSRLFGAFSQDGTKWTPLYPSNIYEWSKKVKVGPYVLNQSSKPKTLRFTALKITPARK